MSIKIIYKGFVNEVPAAEKIAVLARVFNGDKAKAEEALITPDYVLRTIGSQAEIGLILPRLEKLGLRCEVVEQAQGAGSFDRHEVTTRMVVCKFCGYEQAGAKVCCKCGQSFAAVRKINWKPPVDIDRDEEIETDVDEEKSNAIVDWFHQTPIFARRNIVMGFVILGALVGFGIVTLPGKKIEQVTINAGETGVDEQGNDKATNGIDDDHNGAVDDHQIVTHVTPPKNAVLMIVNGIVTSDGKEVAKTATYDPESGENPYAKRLEALGIDQKEFSKAAAGIEGPISGAEVQGIIDNNAMLKNAIDDAVKSSAHSQGSTEADKMIDNIDNPDVTTSDADTDVNAAPDPAQ
jgi:hypothetical protein